MSAFELFLVAVLILALGLGLGFLSAYVRRTFTLDRLADAARDIAHTQRYGR